jgi:hypothetical protein
VHFVKKKPIAKKMALGCTRPSSVGSKSAAAEEEEEEDN